MNWTELSWTELNWSELTRYRCETLRSCWAAASCFCLCFCLLTSWRSCRQRPLHVFSCHRRPLLPRRCPAVLSLDYANHFETPLEVIQHSMNKSWLSDWVNDLCSHLGSEGFCCSGRGQLGRWQVSGRLSLTATRRPDGQQTSSTDGGSAGSVVLCVFMCSRYGPGLTRSVSVACRGEVRWGEHLATVTCSAPLQKNLPSCLFCCLKLTKDSHFCLFSNLYIIHFLNTDIFHFIFFIITNGHQRFNHLQWAMIFRYNSSDSRHMAPWSSLFSWLLMIQKGTTHFAVIKKKKKIKLFLLITFLLFTWLTVGRLSVLLKRVKPLSHMKEFMEFMIMILWLFFSLNKMIWASPPMQFEWEMSRPPAGLWLSSSGSGLCWLVQGVSLPLMDIHFWRNDRKRD